jgi:PmbA protein
VWLLLSDPIYIGEKILKAAEASGFQECAVLLTTTDRSMVKIVNSQPGIVQSWRTYSTSIYVARGERIAQASFDTWSLDQISRKISELSGNIDQLERSMLYAPMPDPDPRARPLSKAFDDKIEKLMEDPRDIAEMMINRAIEEGVERVAGILDLGINVKCLATSKGFNACEKRSFIDAHLRSFKGEGSGHWGYGSRYYDPKELEEAALKSAEYAKLSASQRSIEPGKYDVILSPMVFGELLDSIVRGFTGFSYLVGTTFLANRKPGDRIASEVLTIKDSPHREDMMGSTGFDDEGVSTREVALVEKGVFRSLLHNSKTARAMGTESTGNAGWIMPRPWNICVEQGDRGDEELIRDLRRGLIATNNWYTRYHNFVEGIFSTVLRDAILIVDNGEIVGASRRMRIADTVNNLLTNIEALGKRLYKVKWWEITTPVESPYILVREVRISR